MDFNIGGELPDELKALLGGALGKGPKYVPARMNQLRHLLEKAEPLAIGDIVQLKPETADGYKWPTAEQKCIVTQVLDQPFRIGSYGTPQPAKPLDFALAMLDENDGQIAEYLHDSREFVKVGSIYDPIKLADGEELPVG